MQGQSFAGITLTLATKKAIADLQLSSVVLVCHSLGGMVAVGMISGACHNPEQPYCNNYTEVIDSTGNDIIKGVIMFESGWQTPNSILEIPDEYFLTYLTSPDYANQTSEFFEQTDGRCVQYIELNSGNHYAMTNWNPATAPYQRAPCGRVVSAAQYITAQTDQSSRLTFLAELIDLSVRASVLNETSAVQGILQLQHSHSSYVETTIIPALCFGISPVDTS